MLHFRSECEAIQEQVLEAHDVFAIEEGERAVADLGFFERGVQVQADYGNSTDCLIFEI